MGGFLGTTFCTQVIRILSQGGALVFLILLFLAGLVLATGLSLVKVWERFVRFVRFSRDKYATAAIKKKERQRKAKIRKERLSRPPEPEQPVRIVSPDPKTATRPAPKQSELPFMGGPDQYTPPPFSLLDDPKGPKKAASGESLMMQSRLLDKKLADFGVKGSVTSVMPGPVVTTFEYAPAPGVKINRIVTLADDLALALRAISIRIVAPIPGKSVIGIEIPNPDRDMVYFKEVAASPAFDKSKSPLTLCLGKDIVGDPVVAELDKMPHLLIAGATGTGKSVGLNAMICSILFKAPPDRVRFIMVDPKRIELSMYDGIPHLVTPVVTDAKKATAALFWAVQEMERRYELLAAHKVRNIGQYNRKVQKTPQPGPDDEPPAEPIPYIVVIIDELADLMMVASKEVEVSLTRLAQMARAAGIHLILATQRPSVDVLTGIIKANFPTRLTFQVSSKTDSRTIIDANGAENLLGNGDMLFLPPGTAKLRRIHGAYISEAEITAITDHLRQQQAPEYNDEVVRTPTALPGNGDEQGDREMDERYDDAVALVTKAGSASISMVQRHLRIGYNRAARIIEAMEKEGVVGPADGVKPREVLVKGYDD